MLLSNDKLITIAYHNYLPVLPNQSEIFEQKVPTYLLFSLQNSTTAILFLKCYCAKLMKINDK